MSHSYTCLCYHVVFSTRNREPWLHAELRPRLYEYVSGAIRGEGGFCILANGIVDHLHILARLRQDKAVSEVLRSIKANSWAGFITSSRSSAVSAGKRDMGRSRSANLRWKRCVVTLLTRKVTIGTSPLKKNSWHCSRRMGLSMMSVTSLDNCCSEKARHHFRHPLQGFSLCRAHRPRVSRGTTVPTLHPGLRIPSPPTRGLSSVGPTSHALPAQSKRKGRDVPRP